MSLAPLENCYGGATALIRRSAALQIGGYTEIYGVGHEDHDFYVRALAAGLRIEICPLPLYLYEVDRPGMANTTSRLRNWNRVARVIDLSKQPVAWQDLISLTTGRRAQEHTDNYALYRMANHTQSDLLQRIAHEPVDSVGYPALVAEYATVAGAVSYESALRTLITTRSVSPRDRNTVIMPALVTRPIAAVTHEPEIDALMLGGLIDLSLGRVSDAINSFILTWEREPGPFSRAQERFLGALACHDKLTPTDAHHVLGLLSRQQFDLGQLQIVTPLMFRLSLVARDTELAIEIVDRATIVDEKTYLAAEPSVAGLITHGEFSSALDHFSRIGNGQDGVSLSMLRKIKATLHAQLRVDVPIASLRQYVQSLTQSHQAEADLPHAGGVNASISRNSRQWP